MAAGSRTDGNSFDRSAISEDQLGDRAGDDDKSPHVVYSVAADEMQWGRPILAGSTEGLANKLKDLFPLASLSSSNKRHSNVLDR